MTDVLRTLPCSFTAVIFKASKVQNGFHYFTMVSLLPCLLLPFTKYFQRRYRFLFRRRRVDWQKLAGLLTGIVSVSCLTGIQ